jgi:MEMO1 family protein
MVPATRTATSRFRTGFMRALAAHLCLVLLLGMSGLAVAADKSASAERIHESVIAGSWYPGTEATLRQMVGKLLSDAPETNLPGAPVALIAPHAGYRFSGPVAAYAYKLLEKQKFSTVVVIAPSHYAHFQGISIYDQGGFRTPLGVVPLDVELVAALKQRDERIRYVAEAHEREHSLEIQLPFLQVMMPGFKLVPLVMGEQDFAACLRLADALSDCLRGKSVLVVASSDLSHFHSYDQAKALDQVVVDKVNRLDARGLSDSLASGLCEACGGGPMVTAMLVAQKLGATDGRVLHTANSGDVTGDRSRVVGYLAAAFTTQSGDQAPVPSAPGKVGVDLGLSSAEKTQLRRIARESIEARLGQGKAPDCQNVSGALREPRGAFVTLKKRGELRGCIGHIVGTRPLAETVAEMAQAAAFRDLRFAPLSSSELPQVDIEMSVLTPLQRIATPDQVQVGLHGIYLKRGHSSGLLLPQVATEYGWDRTTFLEQTCRKAGLEKDAWKDKATEIYIFSADVF